MRGIYSPTSPLDTSGLSVGNDPRRPYNPAMDTGGVRSAIGDVAQRLDTAAPAINNPDNTPDKSDVGQNLASSPKISPEDNASQYYQEMLRLRSPENMPMTTAYQKALGERPDRKNYEPSIWRKIAAAAAGGAVGATGNPMGGVKLAAGINDAPYADVMEDYGAKLTATQKAAELEEKDVSGREANLQAAQKMGLEYSRFRQAQEQFDRAQKARDITAGAAVTRSEAEMIRAKAYQQIANNPNYDKLVPEINGTRAIDSKTGNSVFIPGHTVSEVNANVNKMNAQSNAANAATNRGRLNLGLGHEQWTRELGMENLSIRQQDLRRRQQLADWATGGGGKNNVLNQTRADQAVLGGMASDPKFGKYVEPNPNNPKTLRIVPGLSAKLYNAVQDEYNRRKVNVLQGGGTDLFGDSEGNSTVGDYGDDYGSSSTTRED